MLLIAGAALGFWLVLGKLRAARANDQGNPWHLETRHGSCAFVFVLGGLSLIGLPLLLMHRAGDGPGVRADSSGSSRGTAAWLLWPPVVYHRFSGRRWTIDRHR